MMMQDFEQEDTNSLGGAYFINDDAQEEEV